MPVSLASDNRITIKGERGNATLEVSQEATIEVEKINLGSLRHNRILIRLPGTSGNLTVNVHWQLG